MEDRDETGRLEIKQDPLFQRAEWKVQRVGWVLMAVLFVAAITGLLGNGPMSWADALAEDGSIALHYERLARHSAPSRLDLDVRRAADGPVRVWLDRDYVAGLDIESVIPQPDSTSIRDGRVWYAFTLQVPARITFYTRPNTMLAREGAIGIAAGSTVRFKQFVFP